MYEGTRLVAEEMNKAMKILDEIKGLMYKFGKIGLDRYTHIVPFEMSRDVRQLLDQSGINWKLAGSDGESQLITIFIPERYRKK